MLIANQKLRENIAEYVLYMWQVENIIRSLNFDIHLINLHVIEAMTSNEDAREDVREWYEEIIQEMKQNDLVESGHLQRVEQVLEELNFLHNTLLTSLNDKKYKEYFSKAFPFIEELRKKSDSESSDIEICLTAMFGKLMLRMQQREVSKQTEEALKEFAKVLAYLSQQYKAFRSGNLKFQINN